MAARTRMRWLAAWRDLTKLRAFWLASWREIVRVRRWTRTGNTFQWKDVYIKSGTSPSPTPSPTPTPTPTSVTLSVTLSITNVSGTRVGAGSVSTNQVTASAKKGTGPYTYKWTRSTYSGTVAPTIDTPLAAATRFIRNMTGTPPETQTARFKVTATDSKGNKGSAFVDATFLTTPVADTGGDGWVGPPQGPGPGEPPTDYYDNR